MDSINNPFSPNAGSMPPELVGRDGILEDARILLARTQLRRSAQSLLMTGLRGVGKTVILNEIVRLAEREGLAVPIYMEATEERRLGEMLALSLRMALLKLNRVEGAKDKVIKGLSALRNFMGTIKIGFGDIDIALEPLRGVADSGDMQFDLISLFTAVAEAAADKGKAIVLLIDELQYLDEEELGALVMALHRMQQLQLPLVMVGAGLPIIAKLVGEAKSYAERLFKYPRIGALTDADCRVAISRPFADADIRMEEDAIARICEETRGYPYFIQEWGSQLWNFIEREPITADDIRKVRDVVLYSLDLNFFQIRMERVTAAEKEFIRAMASVTSDDGQCGIAAVARALDVAQSAIAQRRASLIRKGMIYSPAHGKLAFTVPLFPDFVKRNEANVNEM